MVAAVTVSFVTGSDVTSVSPGDSSVVVVFVSRLSSVVSNSLSDVVLVVGIIVEAAGVVESGKNMTEDKNQTQRSCGLEYRYSTQGGKPSPPAPIPSLGEEL